MFRHHTSRTILVLIAGLASGLLAEPAHAQQASAIDKLVDGQTIVAARIRIERFEADELAKLFVRQLGEENGLAASFNEPLAHIERELNHLKEAGVEEFYVVMNLATAEHGPVLALAGPSDAAAQKTVREVVERAGLPRTQQIGDLLVAGNPPAVEHLATIEPAPRPELHSAWQSVSEADVAVAVLASADTRRVITETLRIPEQLGGQAAVKALGEVQWISLGIRFPPSFRTTIRVQAKDANATETIEQLIQNALTMAVQDERLPKASIERLRKQLVVQRSGNHVDVVVEEKEGQALAALFRPIGAARESARRQHCMNNLKQIAIAFHNYHDTYRSFPAAATYNAEGKPLLSWRVHLLPYLEQTPLYEAFHLDEPWDSEHNLKLVERMPAVFACPSAGLKPGYTTYRVPTGPKTSFTGPKGITIRDITDGSSNTLMVLDVPATSAVIWTKPDDYEPNFDQLKESAPLQHNKEFLGALFDGSVRGIPLTIDPKTFQLLIDPADGTPIPSF